MTVWANKMLIIVFAYVNSFQYGGGGDYINIPPISGPSGVRMFFVWFGNELPIKSDRDQTIGLLKNLSTKSF